MSQQPPSWGDVFDMAQMLKTCDNNVSEMLKNSVWNKWERNQFFKTENVVLVGVRCRIARNLWEDPKNERTVEGLD